MMDTMQTWHQKQRVIHAAEEFLSGKGSGGVRLEGQEGVGKISSTLIDETRLEKPGGRPVPVTTDGRFRRFPCTLSDPEPRARRGWPLVTGITTAIQWGRVLMASQEKKKEAARQWWQRQAERLQQSELGEVGGKFEGSAAFSFEGENPTANGGKSGSATDGSSLGGKIGTNLEDKGPIPSEAEPIQFGEVTLSDGGG